MKRSRGAVLALAVALALSLGAGMIAWPAPASAAGPITGHFQPVAGVNGGSMSIYQMNLGLPDQIAEISVLAPAVTSQAEASTRQVTEWRVARMGRDYVQISGRYCKNKTGGDVFVADGAPVDAGLSCS